jgi:hypothetical protein
MLKSPTTPFRGNLQAVNETQNNVQSLWYDHLLNNAESWENDPCVMLFR